MVFRFEVALNIEKQDLITSLDEKIKLLSEQSSRFEYNW